MTLLEEFGIEWVRLSINKPGAIRGSRDVGVSIERARADLPRRRGAVAGRAGALAQIPRRAMRRDHRAVHRALWPLLALAVGLGLALALVLRSPPDDASDDASANTPRAASEPLR